MTDSDKPHPAPPPGFKLLAWEGVSLFVPWRWEIGRHEGDERRGLFRVDGESRIVVQVRWYPAPAPVPLSALVEQHAKAIAPPKTKPAVFREQPGLRPAGGPGDQAAVFAAGNEWLAAWRRASANRLVLMRITGGPDGPDPATLATMLSGFRVQSPAESREWALHDLRFATPPGHLLRESHLYAGVCHLAFAKGRLGFALRRFSAADAVMGTASPDPAALDRWVRRLYAKEFFDMRYAVEPFTYPRGRPGLRLTGSRRWLAPIEIRWLIPEHRRLPKRIEVVWDSAANKIYILEVRDPRPELLPGLAFLLERLAAVEVPPADAGMTGRLQAAGPENGRARSLLARVKRREGVRFRVNERGRVVLTQVVEKSDPLRFLRLIGGLPAGPKTIEKSVELDLIGSLVWESCAREPRACELIEEVRVRFRISAREAELSVAEFIRAMGTRGLLAVALESV